MAKIIVAVKGGPGSGFHGHAGRQGKRGGSQSVGSGKTMSATSAIVHSVAAASNLMKQQMNEIEAASIKIGREYFGKGLVFNEGETAFSVANVAHMPKGEDILLGDPDFEYPFVYDVSSRTGKQFEDFYDTEFDADRVRKFYADKKNKGKLFMSYHAEGEATLWVDDPESEGMMANPPEDINVHTGLRVFVDSQKFGQIGEHNKWHERLKIKVGKPTPLPHIMQPDYLLKVTSESKSQAKRRRSMLKTTKTGELLDYIKSFDPRKHSAMHIIVETLGGRTVEGIDLALRYARELRDRGVVDNKLNDIVAYISEKVKTQ